MYRIGVDLGGTNIAAGIIDENYNIIIKKSTPTLAGRKSGEITADIARLCRETAAGASLTMDKIASVGIASPGIADRERGVVVYANNLPFRHFPIAELLRGELGMSEVKIENDANAAAWGEAAAGAARGSKSSVFITLGTGVGGGIVIDERVYPGFNFAGAELGHIVIQHRGRPCTCGRRGCWEAYSSATALINMTREKLAECERSGRATMISEAAENGKISGKTAFAAMRAGDEAAGEVVREYISYLACGLTNIVNIFQPEILSVGGGISGEGQLLLDMLLGTIKTEQYGGGIVEETQIKIAKLGNDAGIIGAALLQ